MGAAGTVVPVAGTAAGLVAGEIAGGYGGAYAGAKAWDNVTSWFSGPPPSAEAAQQTADAVDPLEGLLKELGKKLDLIAQRLNVDAPLAVEIRALTEIVDGHGDATLRQLRRMPTD